MIADILYYSLIFLQFFDCIWYTVVLDIVYNRTDNMKMKERRISNDDTSNPY